MIAECRGIAINPFDKWVFGSLLEIEDHVTEHIDFYIHDNYTQIRVDPKTIGRKIYEYKGIKYFSGDIVEYDYLDINKFVRRIEPIIDDIYIVYIGRQRNELACRIFEKSDDINLKIIGNIYENSDLLDRNWVDIDVIPNN